MIKATAMSPSQDGHVAEGSTRSADQRGPCGRECKFTRQVAQVLQGDLSGPDSCENRYVTINKKERYSHGSRWKLGINTSPCVQSRKGKRCVYCGFRNYHNPVSPSEVGRVFGAVFTGNDLADIHRLELYVSGSFFDDEEVSFNSRREIVRLVEETQIEEVLLESRPEFITQNNLKALGDIIDPRRITVGVGVETMDDRVRKRLSKGFSTKDFVKSLSRIARAGMNFQAYLLLNPPAINNDKKAIIDIVDGSEKLISLTKKMNCPLILAIQPYFIAKGSAVAEDPSKLDGVRPPWLYTIALTLRLLNDLRSREAPNLQIILGNEVDNVDTVLVPSNYTADGSVCACTERMRQYLPGINISQEKMEQSVHEILESPCDCRRVWENEIGCRVDDFRL